MLQSSIVDVLYVTGAALLSISGGAVLIGTVSKLFGDFLSKRVLDGYNNKHSKELEAIKSKYSRELESTKLELEKAKAQFFRYSEKQFELYNDLWRTLVYTRRQADSLWESAIPEKIPPFIEQISHAKNAVEENFLLIEEDHCQKLNKLILQFEGFTLGKNKLIDFRRASAEHLKNEGITEAATRQIIDENRNWKMKYDNLISEIGDSFRQQIKG